MTNYYATAFKTGKFPEITQDALYAWARPTTTNANSGDPVGKPTNSDTVSTIDNRVHIHHETEMCFVDD